MEKGLLEPPAVWATVAPTVMLAASLVVISTPEARTVAMRVVLTALAVSASAESLLRLHRAQGLKMPMLALGKHLPARPSFAESLARIALLVTSLTVVWAF